MPEEKLAAAASLEVKQPWSNGNESPQGPFPAPLVLPGDAIAIDPKESGQSLRSWHREKHRNKVTTERRVLYVAAPSAASPEVDDIVNSWTKVIEHPSGALHPSPRPSDVIEYLEAFYHGMES